MVPHEERNHYSIRSLEAESPVFPLPGCQFRSILADNFSWQKKSSTSPQRGLTSDGEDLPTSRRRTANQKNAHLELMLGQIANFCPVISRNTMVKNSTSVKSIWQAIRANYGFQSTGANFLDFARIKVMSMNAQKICSSG